MGWALEVTLAIVRSYLFFPSLLTSRQSGQSIRRLSSTEHIIAPGLNQLQNQQP